MWPTNYPLPDILITRQIYRTGQTKKNKGIVSKVINIFEIIEYVRKEQQTININYYLLLIKIL